MASYTVGKSRYIMTYTATQSEKTKRRNERYTHKNKPNHNVTVNCNNLFLKAVTERAETTSSDKEFQILTIRLEK